MEDCFTRTPSVEARQMHAQIDYYDLKVPPRTFQRKWAFLSSSLTDKKTQNFYKVFQKTINNSYCAIKAIFSRDNIY